MKNGIYKFFFIFTFIFTILYSFQVNGNPINSVLPSRALIIISSESWGCLNRQEIEHDVTNKVSSRDCNYTRIQEIKNPEDVLKRRELHLIFEARLLLDVPGYLIFKFWCHEDKPDQIAQLSMDFAELYKQKDSDWRLSISAKGNGFANANLFYSRTPELQDIIVTCPEAGIYRPYELTYFNMVPVEANFDDFFTNRLEESWCTTELNLTKNMLSGVEKLDKCQAFLATLNDKFSFKNQYLIWDQNKINEDILRQLNENKDSSTAGKKFLIRLKTDDKRIIIPSPYQFPPHLRQKLMLKNVNGTLTGAELWLRVAD